MNDIKILKTQSLLKEVLQEVLYMLDDTRLNALSIIKVECSKGKNFARVFLDSSSVSTEEQKDILKLLKKANSTIRQYLQTSLSWYKIPNFAYEFDTTLEKINKLESIFKQIRQENDR
ncbi:MAG: 30S ribosome-binding factor RbfA [Helicobacteraceae bacterium]|nr:30S ribosome-binding factor RbfA [Helicobacteraceae bacterium]